MRSSYRYFSVICFGLSVCLSLGVATGQSLAQETWRSGWYLGANVGVNWTSNLQQAGHNRDTTRYPDHDSVNWTDRSPEGYRWFYHLDADRAPAFEISIGRLLANTRIELGAARRRSGIEQHFTNITYLDGSPVLPNPDSPIQSSSTASIDNLVTRTLQLSAYYDFPLTETKLVPYVGAGAGLSKSKLSDLYYYGQYSCKPDTECSDPSQYDSLQDVNASDTDISGHVHAGVDYRLNQRFLLGMKLTYSRFANIKDDNTYIKHKIRDLTNTNEFKGIEQWSLTVGLKYLFD